MSCCHLMMTCTWWYSAIVQSEMVRYGDEILCHLANGSNNHRKVDRHLFTLNTRHHRDLANRSNFSQYVLRYWQQGHQLTGDQAARRPHMMCSICGCRFATPAFVLRMSRGMAHSRARPCISISSLLTNMVYLLPFWSYLVGSKSVPARLTHMQWQIPL